MVICVLQRVVIVAVILRVQLLVSRWVRSRRLRQYFRRWRVRCRSTFVSLDSSRDTQWSLFSSTSHTASAMTFQRRRSLNDISLRQQWLSVLSMLCQQFCVIPFVVYAVVCCVPPVLGGPQWLDIYSRLLFMDVYQVYMYALCYLVCLQNVLRTFTRRCVCINYIVCSYSIAFLYTINQPVVMGCVCQS